MNRATSPGEFLERLGPEQLARIAPRWALDLHAAGVPWPALMRADGLWLTSKEALQGQVGAERFAAAQAIGAAVAARDWPTVRLSRRAQAQHLEMAAALPGDAAAQAVARAIRIGEPVPSRAAHYLKRRVKDGEPLTSTADLDRFLEAPLRDLDSRIYRQESGKIVRWAVYQPTTRRVAVADAAGRRITAYTLDSGTDPDTLGAFKWTLATLTSL